MNAKDAINNTIVCNKTDSDKVIPVIEAHRLKEWGIIRLRGPLLLFVVILPSLIRSLKTLSIEIWYSIVFGFLALIWVYQDLMHWLKHSCRARINHVLNNLILDDVMKNMFDFQNGTLPALTLGMLGNAAMYLLPLSKLQRVKLIQSVLALPSENDSIQLWMTPGGIKHLLPTQIQRWLLCETSRLTDYHPYLSENHTFLNSDVMTVPPETDSETDSVEKCVLPDKLISSSQSLGDKPSPASISSTSSIPQTPLSSDPVSLVRTIALEWAEKPITNLIQRIPDRALHGTVIVSIVALVLHLRCSSQARKLLRSFWEGLTLAGLTSALFGSLIVVGAKSSMQIPNTPHSSRQILRWASSIYNLSRKWKAAFALLLFYVTSQNRSRARG
jgi:hypothetical protein